MKSLEEMGVTKKDKEIVKRMRETFGLDSHSYYGNEPLYRSMDMGGHVPLTDRGSRGANLAVSPNQREVENLLTSYAERMGFKYVRR